MRPSGHRPSSAEATTHTPAEFASDQEWAESIRDGSYPAFSQLFHAYYEDLVRFTIAYVKAPEVAEGLVQDVFFNIWRGRHAWNPRGTLNAYLFGAARNHSLKYLRSRRALNRIKDELSQWTTDEVESPDGHVQYEEFSQAVARAIEALPERRRQVFKLSREQGLSYAEIAAVMGISVNTVENQMVRAMKTLRARLSSFLSVGGSMIVLFDPFFF